MKMVSNIRVWILKLYDAGSFTVIGAEGEFGVSSSIPVQFGFVKFELMKKKASSYGLNSFKSFTNIIRFSLLVIFSH